jgi:hypothetical protein
VYLPLSLRLSFERDACQSCNLVSPRDIVIVCCYYTGARRAIDRDYLHKPNSQAVIFKTVVAITDPCRKSFAVRKSKD